MRTATPYQARIWPHLRRAIFTRDNYTCQIQRPGCTGQAEHLDHIIPWSQGGAWFNPTNLRAACAHCNIGRKRRGPKERRAIARKQNQRQN